MITREASHADVDQLVALGPRIFANAIRGLRVDFDRSTWRKQVTQCLRFADRRILVAVNAGEIVAVRIVAAVAPLFSKQAAVFTLTNWVSPAARHKGIASLLEAAAETWAKTVGASVMMAGVPYDYDAHRELGDATGKEQAEAFYRRRGYAAAETNFIKEVL